MVKVLAGAMLGLIAAIALFAITKAADPRGNLTVEVAGLVLGLIGALRIAVGVRRRLVTRQERPPIKDLPAPREDPVP